MIWNNEKLIEVLKGKGVVVMPTDTIYGLVGKAEAEEVVKRIYDLKKRLPEKPCIILISDVNELEKFSVELTAEQKSKLGEFWSFDSSQDFQPRPTSIILDCPNDKFSYLHRGTNTLAFRMPAEENLRELITKVGPLLAPSANPEGLPPAKNINEARNYFGESLDLYVDGGEVEGKPSKLIKCSRDGSILVLRN